MKQSIFTTDDAVQVLKSAIDAGDLSRLNYRLSDAIREGASVTDQAYGWGDGAKSCALHAAVISAEARGFM